MADFVPCLYVVQFQHNGLVWLHCMSVLDQWDALRLAERVAQDSGEPSRVLGPQGDVQGVFG